MPRRLLFIAETDDFLSDFSTQSVVTWKSKKSTTEESKTFIQVC